MQKPSPKTQIISASLGAVLTTLLMTPFDVIKTRMQVKSTSSTSLEMARLIVKKEGITKLWRGLIPTMGFVLPQTVFYLVTYEKLKQILNNSPGTAGALSRGLAVSLISPVELIRTQIQSQSDSGKIVCGEIIRNVKSNGIGYLWRGLAPTLARDVPFSALYWIGIEKFKSFYDGKMYTYQQELGLSFLNGSVSGMIAAVFTHPFDVVKTLQQVSPPGTTLSKVLGNIYAEKGLRGYWTGLVPRVAKIAPACGIMISSFEVGKRYFNDLGF